MRWGSAETSSFLSPPLCAQTAVQRQTSKHISNPNSVIKLNKVTAVVSKHDAAVQTGGIDGWFDSFLPCVSL